MTHRQMDFGPTRIQQARTDKSVRCIADCAVLGETGHAVSADNAASEIHERTLRCRIAEDVRRAARARQALLRVVKKGKPTGIYVARNQS